MNTADILVRLGKSAGLPIVSVGYTFSQRIEHVYAAWTEASQVAQWWGGEDCTNVRCEIDCRPGGAIAIDTRRPAGTTYTTTGEFERVDDEVIAFQTNTHAPNGRLRFQMLNTVIFSRAGVPAIHLDARFTEDTKRVQANYREMRALWNQSLWRLSRHLTRTIPDRPRPMTVSFP